MSKSPHKLARGVDQVVHPLIAAFQFIFGTINSAGKVLDRLLDLYRTEQELILSLTQGTLFCVLQCSLSWSKYGISLHANAQTQKAFFLEVAIFTMAPWH